MNNDNKKILFYIERLSGGGAERVTANLANSFYENGFDVGIIVFEKSKSEYFINNNINKYYLDIKQSSNKIMQIFNNYKAVKKAINSFKSYTIISLSTPIINKYLIVEMIKGKRKIILSERNDPNNFPESTIMKKIRDFTYKYASSIVFQTRDAKEYFNEDIQKKGIIIPNQIKSDLPKPYKGVRKKNIVNYCRLAKQKNLHLLIDAFNLLSNEYNDYTLTIYGEGPLENELKEYCKDYISQGKIIFKPYSTNIHEEILDSAMFVSSSDYEGISNSMLEALAIGLPTISTNCPIGGAKMFIIPYENGILVPVRDVNALYMAMKEIIENEEMADRFSINAIKVREELSEFNIYKKWLKVIDRSI